MQVIFSKAQQILELHRKNQATQWPDKICVVQPAQPLIPPEIKQDVLTAVHEALLTEKQLRVVYQATQQLDGKGKEYRLHSLGLIQRDPLTYIVSERQSRKP